MIWLFDEDVIKSNEVVIGLIMDYGLWIMVKYGD